MTSNITLSFFGVNHSITVPFKRYLYLLGAFPELIATQISDHKYYNVESPIKQETFDSFKKYLIDSVEPEINSDNMLDFYLLSKEFNILTDTLNTQIDGDSLNLSILISNTITDKSQSEIYISKHLSDIIDKHEQDLLKIPFNSLVNIFYHPERVLSDHQKAYDFIVNNSKCDWLFFLLQSLEADKLNEKSQIESLIKSKERFGYFPVFKQSFFESIIKNKNSADKISKMDQEIQKLQKQIQELQKENQKLKEENQRIKNPEEINHILDSRINETKSQNYLTDLLKIQNLQKNDFNNQIDKLSNLCNLIQEENQQIDSLLQIINKPPVSSSSPSPFDANSGPIIGIDLGTSRCSVGYFRINSRGKKEIEIIANQQGSLSNPSVLFIYKNKMYFGDDAIKMSANCPENLIYDIKRMLGHKFNDGFIQYMRKYWTFKTVESRTGSILIEVEKKYYQPYEIYSMILIELMDLAYKHLKVKTNQASITIPAYFTEEQRKDTIKAAKLAGIEHLCLVEEQKAVSYCYGFKKLNAENKQKSRDIIVYNFGGGFLEVSYIENKGDSFNFLAISGDQFLGGQDFTNCLFANILPKIDDVCNKNWQNNIRFFSYVKNKCNEAKICLSSQENYDFCLDIPPILRKNNKDCLKFNITRKDFENMTNELFERCIYPVIDVIKKVGRDPHNIDELVLIGKTSNLPRIRNKLKKITQKDVLINDWSIDAVVYGACIIAAKYLPGSME